MIRNILRRWIGKTKGGVIYEDAPDVVEFIFTDKVCTDENGNFDPGANQANGLEMAGQAKACLATCQYFFPKMELSGIPTHFIESDINKGTMKCKAVTVIPVEFIWRAKAWGSFCKRYGVEQGLPLHGLIEGTLKDDALGDPLIYPAAACAIGKITSEQWDQCIKYTRGIFDILQREIAKTGYELIDGKVEFGLTKDGQLVLVDELSANIWRVVDDQGRSVEAHKIAKYCAPEHYPCGSPGGCGH